MTNHFKIARPYAKAAFESAQASDDLMLWSILLHALSCAVSDSILQTGLNNPAVTKEKWCDFLIGFLNQIGGEHFSETQAHVENFIRLLVNYQHLNALPEIFILFERYVAKSQGYMKLSVQTPFEMSQQEQADFKKNLLNKLKSEVVVDFQTEAKLIGGFTVLAGHRIFDGSVQSKLKRLRVTLTRMS